MTIRGERDSQLVQIVSSVVEILRFFSFKLTLDFLLPRAPGDKDEQRQHVLKGHTAADPVVALPAAGREHCFCERNRDAVTHYVTQEERP